MRNRFRLCGTDAGSAEGLCSQTLRQLWQWFLQTPGASHNYCNQPVPNSDEGKTCREVGSTKNFRAKVLNNPVWAVHQRAYKKYFACAKKGTMSRVDFEAWERESEQLRDRALSRYSRASTPETKQQIVDQLAKKLNKL